MLDGFLVQVQVTSKGETGNFKAYFSGNYQTYGINIQAECDHKCRFVYAALEDQMILLHLEKHNSVRWFKSCLLESLLLVTLHMIALRLY